MVHQKIINLLDDTKNQLFTFKTTNSVEINDELRKHVMSAIKLNLKLQR